MGMGAEWSAGFSSLTDCFRRHQAFVNGLVYDRCGDAAVAEEVTAQTFEAAAVRFAQGRGDEVTPAWLAVVARRRLTSLGGRGVAPAAAIGSTSARPT